MPIYGPNLLGTTVRGTDRAFPPASPTDHAESLSAPQELANGKEIPRGTLSELQCHPGKCAPPDLIPPKRDAGEHPRHTPFSPILKKKSTDEGQKEVVKKSSRKWLREEKGRRWVEEDYHLIAQRLRELR